MVSRVRTYTARILLSRRAAVGRSRIIRRIHLGAASYIRPLALLASTFYINFVCSAAVLLPFPIPFLLPVQLPRRGEARISGYPYTFKSFELTVRFFLSRPLLSPPFVRPLFRAPPCCRNTSGRSVACGLAWLFPRSSFCFRSLSTSVVQVFLSWAAAVEAAAAVAASNGKSGPHQREGCESC